MAPSLPPESSNYLLFSDVHLGADLVQHTRPWTASRLREALRIDHDLGALLDHYRMHADPERPWRLVIAGDFIDFTGMSISLGEGERVETPLSADDLAHGLGSAQDHAAMKMRAVAARHDLLFRKLAAFVQAGHSLIFVRGNHDVELYWESAQHAFIDALLGRMEPVARTEHAERGGSEASSDASSEVSHDILDRKLFESRIEFRHWFYYVRGFLYVEHGHQYDATCAYHHVLAPRSPRNPGRICYSFSDILVRYIVRPTRELSVDGHENNSIFDYLRLAFSLGVSGCARLGYRFASAVARMVGVWREHLSEHAAHVQAEHDQRMQQIAQAFRLSIDNLRAVAKLGATPITGRLVTIFRTVFLDGLAAAFVSGIVITALGALDVLPLSWLPLVMACVMFGIVVYMKSCRVLEPHDALRKGAEKLAELMPSRYIVMGHTHRPAMEPLADASSRYVNLGNWTIDLLDDDAPPAPCSYLVIAHGRDGKATASLCAWDREMGPRVLSTDLPESATTATPAPADGPAIAAQVAVPGSAA